MPAHARDRSKTPAVLRTRAQAIQRFAMQSRAIALVLRKTIARVQLVDFAHYRVAPDFCEYRRGTDRLHQGIAPDNRVTLNSPVTDLEIWQAVAVYFHQLRPDA